MLVVAVVVWPGSLLVAVGWPGSLFVVVVWPESLFVVVVVVWAGSMFVLGEEGVVGKEGKLRMT